MKKRISSRSDKHGYLRLSNEYEQCTYLTFNRNDTTVISHDMSVTYTLGEMLIDFISLDEDILDLFEKDRLQLIDEIHLINANDFEWDFYGMVDKFIENYLAEKNISKDDFAKKVAIFDLLQHYEDFHPYFTMLDLYTNIIPYDNAVLLTQMLNLKTLIAGIKELAAFCFDVEMEHFGKLSAEKRYYYYHASGRGSIPQSLRTRVLALPDKILPEDYGVFFKTLPKDFDMGKVWKLSSVHGLKQAQDITKDTADYLSNEDIKLYEAYEVQSISEMAYLEIYQMLLANTAIKKCDLCGKYFVMKGDYNNKYCDRKAPGKKQTCQHLGSSKDFRLRKSNSPTYMEYMKAYKRMHSRINYGLITKEKFDIWRDAAKEKKELCERGELAVEDFKAWLGN